MEAILYDLLGGDDNPIQCNLCNHRCIIKNGHRGLCKVRENRDGILESLVYGRLIAANVDPIEKKPLFHLLPGSLSYSIATVGCNFRCLFCQNADIAQMPTDQKGRIAGTRTTPDAVVADALKHACRSIAYTYTEPTVYFEFAYATARLASAKGLKNVFVTNGYMTAEAIATIAPYLDAANVDLKSYSAEFYRKYTKAGLDGVKRSLKKMVELGILVEVTTLIIPGLNDAPDELKALAGFIAGELGSDTPWHVSRFHPTYRLTKIPPTPVETLNLASRIGKDAGLRYVYTGNIPGRGGEDTICYQCGQVLIQRLGFRVIQNHIQNRVCPFCNAPIHGIDM
jgi:pyruvate formate lyase activating enzyme